MNRPITPGYYTLLACNTFQTLEDAFHTPERLLSAKKALSDLPYGLIVSDHDTHDELFFVFQVLPGNRVVVHLGDRNMRADTPADAYQKVSDTMPAGAAHFFTLVWLESERSTTRH